MNGMESFTEVKPRCSIYQILMYGWLGMLLYIFCIFWPWIYLEQFFFGFGVFGSKHFKLNWQSGNEAQCKTKEFCKIGGVSIVRTLSSVLASNGLNSLGFLNEWIASKLGILDLMTIFLRFLVLDIGSSAHWRATLLLWV